eukprot:5001352-Amphidinium_carterae.1
MLDAASDAQEPLGNELEAEDPPASEAASDVHMADRSAPTTPPDTPGAMGSMDTQQNQVAVKTETLSKPEARAAQQKMLTYLKRD